MKTTLIIGLLLAVTAFPGTVADDDPQALIESNLDWLIDQMGDSYIPEARADTSLGPMSLEDALRTAAEFYAIRNIDLVEIQVPAAAGMSDFPLTGYGVILEVGAGGGRLPGKCSTHTSQLNVIGGSVPPATVFSRNGYASSRMSTFTQLDLAIGTDPTLLTLDVATNYNADIFWGPNYEMFCFDFQFCFFGICVWAAGLAGAFEGVAAYDTLGLL